MAQSDGIIENQSAASFRIDVQNAIQAFASNSLGTTAPTTTYAGQWWVDTSTGMIKIRNSANNAWVTVGALADKLGRVHLEANPGYVKFPGTAVSFLVFQWGSTVYSPLTSSGTGTVAFPVAFAGVLTVTVTNGDSAANASNVLIVSPLATTGFNFATNPSTPGGSIRVNWFAVGYQ